MTDEIRVKVSGGFLRAFSSEDPDYPGIWVEFVRDDEPADTVSRPQILMEQPCLDEKSTRVLIWDDPDQEDYTHEILFKPIKKEV